MTATVDARCPQCSAGVVDADRFCEECGADLRARRDGTAATAAGPRTCRHCSVVGPVVSSPVIGDDPEPGHCPDCGIRLPDGTERIEIDLCTVAGVSDRGLRRALNEDAMALGWLATGGPSGPLAAVVCDGVSTSDAGHLAARAGAEAALDVLLLAGARPADECTRDAVATATRAVSRLARPGVDAPACTLVSALVDRSAPDRPLVTVGWVGDSRAYWLSDVAGPSRVLTADHSLATELIAAGLDEAAAMADARAHTITRWLGADTRPEPGIATLTPAGPGALLLCSDGLWNHVGDAGELAAMALPALERGGPLAAADALTGAALAAGGHDNITAVVIPLP